MRVLVTGSSGLVGSALKDVAKYDTANTYIFLTSKDGDLRKEPEVGTIFQKYWPDVVVHLAANVGGLYKNMEQPTEMFEDNILMNTFVLKYSRLFKVSKVILMLSTCIFPDGIDQLTENELHNGPPHPSNEAYAYAKRMMEVQARILSKQYGIQTIILSPTNIYGPNDNYSLKDAHVVPALIHKCWLAKTNKELFVVKGSGKPLRQFIYSYDLADIIISMISSSNESDQGHFICSPPPETDEISIEYVARSIAKCMQYDDVIIFDETYADGQYKKTVQPHQIVKDRFFTSFEEGIKMSVEWFLKNVETKSIRM